MRCLSKPTIPIELNLVLFCMGAYLVQARIDSIVCGAREHTGRIVFQGVSIKIQYQDVKRPKSPQQLVMRGVKSILCHVSSSGSWKLEDDGRFVHILNFQLLCVAMDCLAALRVFVSPCMVGRLARQIVWWGRSCRAYTVLLSSKRRLQ